MPDRFDLIPFQKSHAPEVIRWAVSAEEARQWGGPGILWPLDTSIFQVWHSDPDIQPFVLCDGAIPFGYGEVWVDREEQEVELGRIIIKPADRGQGIGQRLVTLLLEKAAPTGFRSAFIRVVPENRVAIACYHRAGFSPVPAAEQHLYNQGQPLAYHWMECALLPR